MISIAASYLIGIFCVLAWGWWLCRRLSLPNGFAPALGLCCAIAGLAAAGSCGLLGLGTQAFCLGAVLVTVRPKHGLIRGFLVSPGILAFVSGCLVSALLALFTAPSASAGNLTIQGALLFSGDGLSALDFLFGIWLPGKNAHSMPFTLTLLPLAAFSAVMVLVKAEHFTRFFHRILAAVCGAAVGALLFWSSTGQKSFLPISTVWFSLVCLILLFCPGRVLGNFSPLQRAASIGVSAAGLVVLGPAGRGAATLMLCLWLIRGIRDGLHGMKFIRAFASALLPPALLSLWCLLVPLFVAALGM